jgi:hypothetical protein
MPNFLIDKDISDTKYSIENNDIAGLIECVKTYFSKYTETYIQSYKEDMDDEASREVFTNKLEYFDNTIQEAIQLLNKHIEINLDNFTNMKSSDKEMFVKIVGGLIYYDSFSLSSLNERRLIKIMLKSLSMASAQDQNIFERIYEALTIEKDGGEKDKDGNPIKQIWAGIGLGDMTFLLDLLKNTFGKNYKLLNEIFMRINRLNHGDIANKLYCPIMEGECNKFVPTENTYFLAFPFSEMGLEEIIKEAFKNKFPFLNAKIASGKLENKTVLCQACRDILSSQFGVYVLNKHALANVNKFLPPFFCFHKRKLPNSNVTLELGLSIGHGKKFIMLVEDGTSIIADLKGYLYIKYHTIEDIPQKIREHNFNSFYNAGTNAR